ncbi:MAG: hypothetical protein DSZ29_03770 [Aquificaceae bacterium]|nr:MAG: hypothetical protein DSZ29_03770 [Aquificaceae bacterium]
MPSMNFKTPTLFFASVLLLSNPLSAASFPQLAMLTEGASGTLVPSKKKARKAQGSSCLRSVENIKRKAKKINAVINESAKKHRVDSNLIRAIIAVESCYNQKAVSPAGAQGLMQLIPDTAERFGVTDSFNVQQNINAGTKYLRFLLDRFDGDLQKVTAGYNAGEGRVDYYKGVPPFKETQKYVKNVLRIHKALSYKKPVAVVARKKVVKPKPNGRHKYNRITQVKRVVIKPKPVHVVYKPRAMTAKPGRQGWEYNRLRAPQLYKKRR